AGRRDAADHAWAAATRWTTAFTMSGPWVMRASTFVKAKPRTARPTRTTMKSMYRVASPPFCVKVAAISYPTASLPTPWRSVIADTVGGVAAGRFRTTSVPSRWKHAVAADPLYADTNLPASFLFWKA